MAFQVKTEMGKRHYYQILSVLAIQCLDRDSSDIADLETNWDENSKDNSLVSSRFFLSTNCLSPWLTCNNNSK